MDHRIDIARLRLKETRPIADRTAPPRHGKGQKFLKGPIPMSWLNAAMALPGKALHVGVMAWFRAGLKRNKEVAVSLSRFREVGISRSSASRALSRLEKAGLVSVSRGRGRKPVVTLLPLLEMETTGKPQAKDSKTDEVNSTGKENS